jgi:hypothetical protein
MTDPRPTFNEHGVGGEAGQLLGPDHVSSMWGQWCADHDRVAPGEQVVDADRP